jgi:hypothetical protein
MRIGRARVARGLPPNEAERSASEGLIGGDVGDRGPAPGVPPFNPSAVPPGKAEDPVDIAPRFRPRSEPGPSTPGPLRCPFLRSVGPDGRLADSQTTAVPTHRCAAFGDPLPLSLRQQELVCLQRVYVSCPRYVRGTVLANENAAPAAVRGEGTGLSVKTAAAIVLVITAIAVLITGPILGVLPFGGVSRSTQLPAVSPSPAVTATLTPAATRSPSPAPTPTASPTSAATPTVTPTATPTSTPVPTSSWPPGATASRMNLVVPCTDQPNCYVYTVRGAGENGSKVADTLPAIATFFGVDPAKIREMNPSLGGSDVIHPGDKLKIPPPTR